MSKIRWDTLLYYVNSECIQGEELIFVVHHGSIFAGPYTQLLKRKSGKLFESGISQMYDEIMKKRRIIFDNYWLAVGEQNVSSADLSSSSPDFSLRDPQGQITFYFTLIGLSVGILGFWLELASLFLECNVITKE